MSIEIPTPSQVAKEVVNLLNSGGYLSPPVWLDAKELAGRLNTTTAHIYKMCHERKIPFQDISTSPGRIIPRFSQAAIDKWLCGE